MAKEKVFSREENNIYHTGEYFQKNPQYHVEDSLWKAQQIQKLLFKQNLLVNSVCEIGCGGGEVLRQLQLQMPQSSVFFGYEISPYAYEICKSRENERLHFYLEDILVKDIKPVDLLLCLDVFEHVEDYLGFLRIVKQKAKYKIFHIPLDLSINSLLRYRSILYAREKVGHLHYFMKVTALATLRDTGYQIIDYIYTPSSLDRGKGIKSKIAKLPRKVLYKINQDVAVRILGGYSLLVLTH